MIVCKVSYFSRPWYVKPLCKPMLIYVFISDIGVGRTSSLCSSFCYDFGDVKQSLFLYQGAYSINPQTSFTCI